MGLVLMRGERTEGMLITGAATAGGLLLGEAVGAKEAFGVFGLTITTR